MKQKKRGHKVFNVLRMYFVIIPQSLSNSAFHVEIRRLNALCFTLILEFMIHDLAQLYN